MGRPPRYSRCATNAPEDNPLHPSHDQIEKEAPEVFECVTAQSSRRTWCLFIAIQVGILALYAFTILCLLHSRVWSPKVSLQSSSQEHLIYSPAHEAVTIQLQAEDNSNKASIYTGNPGPDNDVAWSKLLRGYNLRISHSALQRLNRTSITLADGSGDHWGVLTMYHHLHCLKTLRHYIARDLYENEVLEFKKTPGQVYPMHIEHCIEGLRQYIMCQPDLTVWTFDWKAGFDSPVPNHHVDHECVNWDKLQDWVDRNSFSLDDGLIRSPNGTVWPEPRE